MADKKPALEIPVSVPMTMHISQLPTEVRENIRNAVTAVLKQEYGEVHEDALADVVQNVMDGRLTDLTDDIEIKIKQEYGYRWEGMLHMDRKAAEQLFPYVTLYALYPDNTESMIESETDLQSHIEGVFGVEREDLVGMIKRLSERQPENLTTADKMKMFQSMSYEEQFKTLLSIEIPHISDELADKVFTEWMERDDVTELLNTEVISNIIDSINAGREYEPSNRLFVDMDGTLAEFIPCKTMEVLYEPGYFAKLKPLENVVENIRAFIKENPDTEVYILSSVLSGSRFAEMEKNAWLDTYLPEIDLAHRIYPRCGDDKTIYIPSGIKKSDILLDDYSVNLFDFEKAGGKAVKLMNGINGNKGKWRGEKVDYQSSSLSRDIAKAAGLTGGNRLERKNG